MFTYFDDVHVLHLIKWPLFTLRGVLLDGVFLTTISDHLVNAAVLNSDIFFLVSSDNDSSDDEPPPPPPPPPPRVEHVMVTRPAAVPPPTVDSSLPPAAGTAQAARPSTPGSIAPPPLMPFPGMIQPQHPPPFPPPPVLAAAPAVIRHATPMQPSITHPGNGPSDVSTLGTDGSCFCFSFVFFLCGVMTLNERKY